MGGADVGRRAPDPADGPERRCPLLLGQLQAVGMLGGRDHVHARGGQLQRDLHPESRGRRHGQRRLLLQGCDERRLCNDGRRNVHGVELPVRKQRLCPRPGRERDDPSEGHCVLHSGVCQPVPAGAELHAGGGQHRGQAELRPGAHGLLSPGRVHRDRRGGHVRWQAPRCRQRHLCWDAACGDRSHRRPRPVHSSIHGDCAVR
mmetsp:Transcript_28836/g.69033  ORF Transcript_28836/g.69033 Transcript_28836/m.69033 type:complete len:203 (-) Transcript_28836:65-673(-)